ncbi:hypothetical protein BD626DRAFT_516232, partial [Schizophyllum amplum]
LALARRVGVALALCVDVALARCVGIALALCVCVALARCVGVALSRCVGVALSQCRRLADFSRPRLRNHAHRAVLVGLRVVQLKLDSRTLSESMVLLDFTDIADFIPGPRVHIHRRFCGRPTSMPSIHDLAAIPDFTLDDGFTADDGFTTYPWSSSSG